MAAPTLRLFLVLLTFSSPAWAVIVMGDQGRNLISTTPPPTSSGWQYEFEFGGFLGTAIAPGYFATAQHIGGSIGQSFTFNSKAYTTAAFYDDANSDLRIWKIADGQAFDLWAPLYTGTTASQVGLSLTVFGRGTARGAAISLAAAPRVGEDPQRGWLWGGSDGAASWGSNTVSGFTAYQSGGTSDRLLVFNFTRGAGTNEAGLSSGDSGGAVFVLDLTDGIWKLAGINYAVEGPFRLTANGTSFDATVYDTGNLYESVSGNFVQTADRVPDINGISVGSSISAAMPFINSVIPEPGVALLLATAAPLLLRRRRAPVATAL